MLLFGDSWSISLAAFTAVDGLLLSSFNVPHAYSWVQAILGMVMVMRFKSLGLDAVKSIVTRLIAMDRKLLLFLFIKYICLNIDISTVYSDNKAPH